MKKINKKEQVNDKIAQKLKQVQIQALGEECQLEIFNENIDQLYRDYDYPTNYNHIQTFNDFLNSNRNKIELLRNKIGIINLSKKNNINILQEIIEKFFQLQVKVISTDYQIFFKKNHFRMIDKKRKLQHAIQSNKKRMNVFDIMAILKKEIPNDCFTIACFVDQPIYDPKQIHNEIFGRAIGNRICVIQQDPIEQQFFQTIVHELMHTFGIGHCTLWLCLMNPGLEEGLNLCPVDLRKLQAAIGFKVRDWYQQMLEYFEKRRWYGGIEWINEIQKCI